MGTYEFYEPKTGSKTGDGGKKTEPVKKIPYSPIPHATGAFDLQSQHYSVAETPREGSVYDGDTIYSIARRFDVTVKELMDANQLDAPVITPGQTLYIPLHPVQEQETPPQQTVTGTATQTAPAEDETTVTAEQPGQTTEQLPESKPEEEQIKEEEHASDARKVTPDDIAKYMTEGMDLANSDDERMNYPAVPIRGINDYNKMGYLSPDYWTWVGYSDFAMKKNVLPSDAIEAAFNGPARTECLSMMSAVIQYTLYKTMGKDAFNEYFKWKSESDPGLVIGRRSGNYDDGSPGHGLKERWRDFTTTYNLEPEDENVKPNHALLKPGDWVYYVNHPHYPQKHPDGLWRGENAVYLGEDKFSGFGLPDMNENQFFNNMKRKFNEAPSSEDKQSSSYNPAYKDEQITTNYEEVKDLPPGDAAMMPQLLYNNVVRIDLEKLNAYLGNNQK